MSLLKFTSLVKGTEILPEPITTDDVHHPFPRQGRLNYGQSDHLYLESRQPAKDVKGDNVTTEDKRVQLDKIYQDRGYKLEVHGIMMEADPDWVEPYDQFIRATYTGQRTIDRKTKELLQVAVSTALRADEDHIRAHIRVALDNGATPRELLETLECVIMLMGGIAFRRGAAAWAAETGLSTS